MKKKSLIFILGSAFALLLYVNFIAPDISKPGSIAGFFALVYILCLSSCYMLLGKLKEKSRRFLWSGIIAVFIVYICALSSLRSLSLSAVSIASVVMAAMLFVVEKSYAR